MKLRDSSAQSQGDRRGTALTAVIDLTYCATMIGSAYPLLAYWPRLLVALAMATSLGCASVASAPSMADSNRSSTESLEINTIFEKYFEAYLELFPLYATQIGDHRYDHRLAVNIAAPHRAAQGNLYQETLDAWPELRFPSCA